MKINSIPTKEITDFENEIGVELIVTERQQPLKNVKKYYVHFRQAEVMEGGCLIGISGDGNTIDEALSDYAKRIQNKKVAIGAYTSGRREITFPKLIHTKLIESIKH